MASYNDYNWEMTGPPDEVTIATNPEAVADYNRYVAEVTSGQGGGVSPNIPQFIDNPIYEDPTYWNSGKQAYQGGDGQTYYAENFLRPEEYVSMGYAAPYSREQLLAAVNPDNIRYGFGNTPYAGIFSESGQSAGEYVVDPNTGRFVLDQSGNPIAVPREPQKSGAFDSFMEKAIPALLFAGAAGTGLGALGLIGAGAAGGTALGAPALASTGEVGLLSNPLVLAALKGSGYGALTGGVTSALTGQDALKGALIGGATGGILGGGEAALFPGGITLASNPITNAGLLGAARGSAGGAINTLLGGGDLKTNILYGGVSGGALGAGAEYFFPSAPTQGVKPQQVVGGDMSQEIANMELMNEYDRAYGLKRASNYEMADWVTRLDEIPLEQQRMQLIDEGFEPAAVNVATMPRSEIESYLNENTIDGASGIEAYDRARAIEMKYGSTIGEAGEAGINMPLYTDTPLDQQYINQDIQEGRGYYTPDDRSWLSGFGNLGTLLGMGALGGLGRGAGGGGGAAARGAAGGSFVPKGMVDYSGILNLLAPKTSTRSSLLG
jgi:hypothetical protein